MVSALVPVAALLIALAPGPAGGLNQVAECVGAGGTGRGGGLPLTDVHALADGTGVRVAVIDTGVAPHPRLPRLVGGGDYLTGGDGLTDCDGHGTAVAGLLAAAPSPDDDVVGVAPGVEVVAIRQASPSFTVTTADGGTRPAGDTASLAQAVRRAVGLGASVVTISEAVCLDAERAAVVGRPLRAALQTARAADVLVVAAAGNAGSGGCTGEPGEVPLPAAAGYARDPDVLADGVLADGVLAVAATTPDDAPAAFTVHGPWVDLAARGTGLRSLAPGSGLTGADLQGTSLAVPIVAGTAALVRQRFPGLDATAVAARLVATARRVPGGRSDALGAGVVDPLSALTILTGGGPPPAAAAVAARPPAHPTPAWLPLAAVTVLCALAAASPLLARRLRP
ncbi:type VII secretion-associated serine protease mycosin [Pseudonocardia sp. RS11V-5]|uniref:type VII secretion-associated serine protease mycosin n=1 Tax=Pseudonocardia terrae TaxID=2905831 RepID=UPI001E46DD6E|nr:type VII secretion-associated serine protease mycosin [Pseudonocardia terrae]MCE3555665.1 type VII secretion-associated serine protease mycosin [Pseudonocardia terrae]